MNLICDTPLVLLCPAWKKYGLEPVGKLRDDLGHDLPLGLGEPDGEMWRGGRHLLTPGP